MNKTTIIYPSAPLSSYVKYYWIVKTKDTNNIQTIPSGCIHLVFHKGGDLCFSNGKKQPKFFIRGQLSSPGVLLPSGNIDMIAVVFHPLGIIPCLTFPINELYNQYIDIDDIEDTKLKELKEMILHEENVCSCIKFIENFLLEKINGFADYNYTRIFNSIQLAKKHIQIGVSDLADNACLGYRHFKREFSRYLGMDPKEYLRVIRFQKALYILQNNPRLDMADLAYSCGFYDNSHLVKEFRWMTGYTPSEYLSSRNLHSTFFSDDCRINYIKTRWNK